VSENEIKGLVFWAFLLFLGGFCGYLVRGPVDHAPTTITSPEGHQFYIGRDMKPVHTIPCPKCGEDAGR
jgi:hypothetical protein